MNKLIISHLTLRKSIGILGIALAFVVMLGGLITKVFMPSISAYYITNMRDILVGTLAIAGAFLLSYNGYSKEDKIITSIAGVAAILIGLFPCCSGGASRDSFLMVSAGLSNVIHYGSSAIFFLLLGYMSYFQFTKTNVTYIGYRKKSRNLIYRICGLTIFASILILFIIKLFFTPGYSTLFFETVMLTAFGTSWLTKGDAILKDLEKK